MNRRNIFRKKVLRLQSELSDAHLSQSEFEAEYYGEIARFGDAWPGSAIQHNRISEYVGNLQNRLDKLMSSRLGNWFIKDRKSAKQTWEREIRKSF